MERVQATPSGTVVVVRDASAGLELLMLQRSTRKADYFSGAWVFPGGKVEPSDGGDDELSRARSAAVREANEEAGLHLEPSHVLPLNRWEPEPSPRQPRPFSAWIFLCASNESPVIDQHEIVDLAWKRPSDCLASFNEGSMILAPPTWVTVLQLSQYRTVEDLMSWAQSRQPEHFYTRFGEEDGTELLLWHGDELFDGTPGGRHRARMEAGVWSYERNS